MLETKRTPERLIEAKRLYTQPSLRVDDAAEIIGISPRTLSKWAKDEGWPSRGRTVPLKPAREARESWRGRTCPGLLDCPERQTQVAKAWAAAEAQVDAIAALGLEAPEKSAQALAIVVRTLKELTALDAETARAKSVAATAANAAPKEATPFHDLDSLRDEIARRLRSVAAERHPDGAGEPEA